MQILFSQYCEMYCGTRLFRRSELRHKFVRLGIISRLVGLRTFLSSLCIFSLSVTLSFPESIIDYCPQQLYCNRLGSRLNLRLA